MPDAGSEALPRPSRSGEIELASVPWRARLAAEFIGTFAIVFFGCGAVATFGFGGSVPGHLGSNIVFGLTVAASIFTLGHISGAHFNPVVTLGFAVARRFPWRELPSYVLAQCLGGVAASACHALLVPSAEAAKFGATIATVDPMRAIGLEVILTFFLMLVSMAAATDARVSTPVASLCVGGTVTLCALMGGPLSGCSMNPARSLGPALFAGGEALGQFPIFIFGPVSGALIAVGVYQMIRGSA